MPATSAGLFALFPTSPASESDPRFSTAPRAVALATLSLRSFSSSAVTASSAALNVAPLLVTAATLVAMAAMPMKASSAGPAQPW